MTVRTRGRAPGSKRNEIDFNTSSSSESQSENNSTIGDTSFTTSKRQLRKRSRVYYNEIQYYKQLERQAYDFRRFNKTFKKRKSLRLMKLKSINKECESEDHIASDVSAVDEEIIKGKKHNIDENHKDFVDEERNLSCSCTEEVVEDCHREGLRPRIKHVTVRRNKLKRYDLRPKRPPVDRLEPTSYGHQQPTVFRPVSSPPRQYHHRKERFRRRETVGAIFSGSDSEDKSREPIKPHNMTAEMARSLAFGRGRATTSTPQSWLADVDPIGVDDADFASVGGLDEHVFSLKEMIILPLLYPDLLEKFSIKPIRGVLFHGPPGTGKTLVARALAHECSRISGQKVAFFIRKGADCLSKWVGESERQLHLLFEQAHLLRPSVVFFDELDGLAPVRSSKQDQIHSSIVSTLLALMDGLEDRGQVVVIGATNRLDAIDPALRRPGRFDRELLFSLPTLNQRMEIFRIHTRTWVPPLSLALIQEVMEHCDGYSGADIRHLCTEAAFDALREKYPQIYEKPVRFLLDTSALQVSKHNFIRAAQKIKVSSQRNQKVYSKALPKYIEPLYKSFFEELNKKVLESFKLKSSAERKEWIAQLLSFEVDDCPPHNKLFILLKGEKGMGQSTYVAPALFHALGCEVQCIDFASLSAFSETLSVSIEEALVKSIRDAFKRPPCAIYLPRLCFWLRLANKSLSLLLRALLDEIPIDKGICVLFTVEDTVDVDDLEELCGDFLVWELKLPSCAARHSFFRHLLANFCNSSFSLKKQTICIQENLPEAPFQLLPSSCSSFEIKYFNEESEALMREFRIYLRQVLNRVSKNSRFRIFLTPVSLEEHPKYLAVVDQPMDLSLIMQKINDNAYIRPYEFVEDIKLITKNALVYFKKGDSVTNRAIELQDEVASLMADLREEFVKDCERLYRIKQKLNESDQYYENCEAEINVINSNKYDDIYNNNTSDIKKTHENFSTECSTENCVVNEPMTAKVDELLDILVSRTEKLPIKKLTEVYSELKELIYKHRLEGDRHVTLQAMFSYAAELDEISHSEHVPTNICL